MGLRSAAFRKKPSADARIRTHAQRHGILEFLPRILASYCKILGKTLGKILQDRARQTKILFRPSSCQEDQENTRSWQENQEENTQWRSYFRHETGLSFELIN